MGPSDDLDIDALEAEFDDGKNNNLCPVCGGTGWLQEGWGEYNMDGIPCLACEGDEYEIE